MTDLEMWSGLVAFCLPLLIAVVQQPRFSNPLRVLIMAVSSAGAAAVTAALQGDLDWHRWSHSLLVVAIGAIVFYQGVWKPTGIAPKVERATSVSGDGGYMLDGLARAIFVVIVVLLAVVLLVKFGLIGLLVLIALGLLLL